MRWINHFWAITRTAFFRLGIGGVLAFWHLTVMGSQSVTLTWNPSVDPNVAGYKIYFGVASHTYSNSIVVGNVTNSTVTGLADNTTYYFAATTYNSSGTESVFSNEAIYDTEGAPSSPTNIVSNTNAPPATNEPPVTAPSVTTNKSPTLNKLKNLKINENSSLQTVALAGISSGATTENQTLTVRAISSNPALIPNPAVSYVSPNAAGTLTFAPAANASGKATITVTVNNGQSQNNTVSQTFIVTVKLFNHKPTINRVGKLTIAENAGRQIVNLSGITSGAANEIQPLSVTAVSSKPGLIPNPVINYSSPNSTGTLTFAPVANAIGTAKITVTVNDGQTKNPTAKCTFTVSVTAVNQAPTLNPIADLTINKNSGNQSVDLSGITSGAANEKQKLKVTAISANPALIPDPTISYKSPNSTGTLTFAPVTNAVGTTSITVTVNDGGKNNNTIARTFNVTILNPASSNIVISIQPAAAVNQETGAQIMIVKAPVILKSNAFTFTNTIILTGQPASVPDDEPAASAVLGTPNYLNGQFTLTVTGTAGSNYAVQASSNLQDWVSIETNASPFIFVDVNAAQFNQRFYRAVYLPPVLQ